MPPSGRIHKSLGPLSSLPSKSFTTTSTVPSGRMHHSSFFSSAHAHRLPSLSRHSPLERPQGCLNVESFPSTDHLRMRSLGWSVNRTLPSASQAGPSVNLKPSANWTTVAPGATMSSAACSGTASRRARRTDLKRQTGTATGDGAFAGPWSLRSGCQVWIEQEGYGRPPAVGKPPQFSHSSVPLSRSEPAEWAHRYGTMETRFQPGGRDGHSCRSKSFADVVFARCCLPSGQANASNASAAARSWWATRGAALAAGTASATGTRAACPGERVPPPAPDRSVRTSMTPDPMTPAPMTPAPMTPAPMTPAPMTPAP